MSEINVSNVTARRAMETLQTDVQFVQLYPDAGPLEGIEGSLPVVVAKCRKSCNLGVNDIVVVGLKVETPARRSAARKAPQFRYQTFRVAGFQASSGLSLDSDAVIPWVVQKVEVTQHEEALLQEERFLSQYAEVQQKAVAEQTRKALMAHLDQAGLANDLRALLGSSAFPEGSPVSASVEEAKPAFEDMGHD